METTYTERLADLPPSCKLVFLVLKEEKPLTQQELKKECRLVGRTTRYALNRLDEEGFVETKISFQDARQHIHSLSKEGEEVAEALPR